MLKGDLRSEQLSKASLKASWAEDGSSLGAQPWPPCALPQAQWSSFPMLCMLCFRPTAPANNVTASQPSHLPRMRSCCLREINLHAETAMWKLGQTPCDEHAVPLR